MKLSPGQVREVLGLSQDTYRHWKAALPPLAGRNGYRPCFTPGDLLAMAVVKALTDDAGVRVRALQTIAESLFDHCGRHSWVELERSTLVLELAKVQVTFVPEQQLPQLNGIGLIVPCRPIVLDLRERLLMDKRPADQGNLHFPPTVVSGQARGRRAS
jgi:DNA-binding transcriptional MerR regulator